MRLARVPEPVRSWHLEGSLHAPKDVVEFESPGGGTTFIELPPAHRNLLVRACHPSLVWRVLAWEPHWSASSSVELRPSGVSGVTARVIDAGSTVTAIYRVPLIVALSIARQGGLPVAIHPSLIGRRLRGDDAGDQDELDEFKAFLLAEERDLAPQAARPARLGAS